jgi:hypothetical protein
MYAAIAIIGISCQHKDDAPKEADAAVPVTVTHIDATSMSNFTDLNATTAYIVKNTIKANTTGYLDKVNVVSNDYVKKGQVLFALKTREAKVLGNTINEVDPNLKFGSAILVRATSNGFISAVNAQQGDYVQDGDALAVINDSQSFSVVLSLPYALKKYVSIGKVFTAYLPDGTNMQVKVERFMPSVDAPSQTQNVVLKCLSTQNLPENLIVKVRINMSSAAKTTSLPKAAVLGDETETDFWIMKMINKDTAVKIPIKKGIETADRIEVLSPKLTANDLILLTGNYGVGDTIKVSISNK